MSKTARTSVIEHYRACDERIAAKWYMFHEANREAVAIESKIDARRKSMHASYARNGESEKTMEDERVIALATNALEMAKAKAASLRKDAVDLNEELYTGWSRFFLVKHIHSNLHCSSFRYTTVVKWLPSVSGLTEVEAVAEHGETLCTICFPSAPVELTTKTLDEGYCSGSGQRHSSEHLTGREGARYGASGYCPVCLRWTAVTKSGLMRKHKVDENRRHATSN